jgi:hypothetical protein
MIETGKTNRCKTCKKEFKASKHHPNQIYCHPNCRAKGRTKKQEIKVYRLSF